MGAYIIVGHKKLGVEFMIAMLSYMWTFLMGHFVTLRPGIESAIFYIVGFYNVVMHLVIASSDPGWLDDNQKDRINRLVSHTFIFTLINNEPIRSNFTSSLSDFIFACAKVIDSCFYKHLNLT